MKQKVFHVYVLIYLKSCANVSTYKEENRL